ncbi:hypothetical protein [Cellulophaga fucicola]|uniref:hypothetical protein n=1 Tax=Cellulophaga fucicola TaxID=76595 RepID=UPI003EB9F886
MNLLLNKKYTLFIDNSVSGNLNTIRIIKKGDRIIYQENMRPHFWFGIILILIGTAASIALYFIGKEIVLSYNDSGYSELLSDETAFSFGSDYDSTNEYASWYVFTIIDGKLTLLEHNAAG